VVWDIGCGNGQLSVALAARFDRVIATDPAQAQLDHAERHPRVAYRCEPAEASSLPDASVDLAVAAQAAHWFDWPRFVPEVGRVVRPGGLIALVTYFNAELDGEAGALLAAFYADIAPHWPGGRTHVNNRYRDLVLPWPAVEAPAIHLTARWTREELFGYDVVICSDINRAAFTQEQLDWTVELVHRRGGGFAMVGGNTSFSTGFWHQTAWDGLIPVDMSRQPLSGRGTPYTDQGFRVRVPPEAERHPIWRIVDDPVQNRDILDRMPAFSGTNLIQRSSRRRRCWALRIGRSRRWASCRCSLARRLARGGRSLWPRTPRMRGARSSRRPGAKTITATTASSGET